jgi:hypothetical protein
MALFKNRRTEQEPADLTEHEKRRRAMFKGHSYGGGSRCNLFG